MPKVIANWSGNGTGLSNASKISPNNMIDGYNPMNKTIVKRDLIGIGGALGWDKMIFLPNKVI